MAQVDSENSTATPTDPIYAAIDVHRAAYATYDAVAEGPDDENEEAFRAVDLASQRLMRAEASTLQGLTALLRYVAPLFQEAGAPALPIEMPHAGRWSAAFGTFCANVGDRLAAIVTAQATPERIDDREAGIKRRRRSVRKRNGQRPAANTRRAEAVTIKGRGASVPRLWAARNQKLAARANHFQLPCQRRQKR